MLEIPMKINGCTAVHIYGHNKSVKVEGKYVYYYEVHLMDKNRVVSGEVSHYSSEGLEKLGYLILEDYLKKEKKL